MPEWIEGKGWSLFEVIAVGAPGHLCVEYLWVDIHVCGLRGVEMDAHGALFRETVAESLPSL